MSNDIQKVYNERHIRWSESSRSQLSFLNNLLSTVGIGVLAIVFKDKDLSRTQFTLGHIDLDLTLEILSLIFLLTSISFGFITALNRLWDFRITRRITLIRKRMYKHAQRKLDESSPKRYSFIQILIMYTTLLFREKYPTISIEQCKQFNECSEDAKKKILNNFKKLRSISYNLGLKTWRNLKIQILTLGISILFFASSIIF